MRGRRGVVGRGGQLGKRVSLPPLERLSVTVAGKRPKFFSGWLQTPQKFLGPVRDSLLAVRPTRASARVPWREDDLMGTSFAVGKKHDGAPW